MEKARLKSYKEALEAKKNIDTTTYSDKARIKFMDVIGLYEDDVGSIRRGRGTRIIMVNFKLQSGQKLLSYVPEYTHIVDRNILNTKQTLENYKFLLMELCKLILNLN